MISYKKPIVDLAGKIFGKNFLWWILIQWKRWQIRIGRELSQEGKEALEFLSTLIKKGSTVLDIGAYIGLFAGHLQKMVGSTGRVLAFEPIPDNFQILKRLWQKHSAIELYNFALSDKDGESEFIIPQSSFNCISTAAIVSTADQLSFNKQPEYRRFTIQTRSLDSLINELGLSQVSFLKCDVEGHEFEVIKGAQKLLKTQHPLIYLEILREKWVHGDPLKSDVAQLLQSLGYRVWQIKARALIGSNHFDTKIENFLFTFQSHS